MRDRLTAARPYAEALFELAREEGDLEGWSANVDLLAAIVADPDMSGLIRDPRVSDERLQALILDIGRGHFDQRAKNLVRVLIDAGRLALAPEMARLFAEHRSKLEGVAHVELVSAYALESTREQGIAEAVGRRFGKKVELSTRVDRDLIGGAVIKLGDHVIDLSVRGRLRALARGLA